nr:delta-type opioid receptor-like [Ciona intestinalis]|eukprot:XP_018667829.1 delta-type opioid receptor-like [Ciona intestinalis]
MNSNGIVNTTSTPQISTTTEGYSTLIPEYARIMIIVVYMFVFVFGTIGNACVIVVMMIVPKFKTPTDIFILNLSFADLLFSSSLIFWAVEQIYEMVWFLGVFMCKALSAVTLINLHASVLFLAAMAVNRCKTVRRKRQSSSYGDIIKAKVSCVIIWLVAAIISSLAWFRKTEIVPSPAGNVTRCLWRMPDTGDRYVWERIYFGSRVLMGFTLPLIVIIISYVLVVMRLRHTRQQVTVKSSMQMRVTITVFAVIAAFVICWLPNHVTSIIHALTLGENEEKRKDLHTYELNLISNCLVAFNSCINPILYAWLNKRFRDQLKMIKCCSGRMTKLSVGTRNKRNYNMRLPVEQHDQNQVENEGNQTPQNGRTNVTLLQDGGQSPPMGKNMDPLTRVKGTNMQPLLHRTSAL